MDLSGTMWEPIIQVCAGVFFFVMFVGACYFWYWVLTRNKRKREKFIKETDAQSGEELD